MLPPLVPDNPIFRGHFKLPLVRAGVLEAPATTACRANIKRQLSGNSLRNLCDTERIRAADDYLLRNKHEPSTPHFPSCPKRESPIEQTTFAPAKILKWRIEETPLFRNPVNCNHLALRLRPAHRAQAIRCRWGRRPEKRVSGRRSDTCLCKAQLTSLRMRPCVTPPATDTLFWTPVMGAPRRS